MGRSKSSLGIAALFTGFCLHGALAGAQAPVTGSGPTVAATDPASPGLLDPTTPVKLPRFDAGGDLGWYHRDGGASSNYWSKHNSLWTGVQAGYCWTENVKTEVGVATTGESRVYGGDGQVWVGSQGYYESGEQFVRSVRLSVAQIYQFGHNAWVHPFLGIGVQAIRERTRSVRWRYPITTGSSGYVPQPPETVSTGPDDEVVVRGLVMAGLKAYMTRRVYFRTDCLVGLRGGIEESVLRFGVGVDF